jgi:carboxyl-terminal processing protease
MRRSIASLLALSLSAALQGCPQETTCSEGARKAAVLGLARDWYLYDELIPDGLSTVHFGSAEALLDAVTAPAREQGLERAGWTYLLSRAAYDRYYGDAQSVGYGFSLVVLGARPDQRLMVKQVFAGSAAASAGFLRGDEIVAIGPDAAHLTAVDDAADLGALASAGGASGVAKTWSVVPRGGEEPVLRTMRSAPYDVDPVPAHRIWDTTGYVQLRTFIPAADDALREAFADFAAQGVENVIVDLRYNGGGSVDTAVLLANLLGQDLTGGEMFSMHFNAGHAGADVTQRFATEPSGGAFRRIAFITTGGSASASELVPNALDPYRTSSTIAYAGGRTYGKPLGQLVFSLGGCDTVVFLIAFRLENSAGDAGYFEGLPDASSQAPLCPADDDLTRDQDDPAEAMTAAAKHFVENGACPPLPALRASRAAAPIDHLVGRGVTPAEREMPGTF